MADRLGRGTLSAGVPMLLFLLACVEPGETTEPTAGSVEDPGETTEPGGGPGTVPGPYEPDGPRCAAWGVYRVDADSCEDAAPGTGPTWGTAYVRGGIGSCEVWLRTIEWTADLTDACDFVEVVSGGWSDGGVYCDGAREDAVETDEILEVDDAGDVHVDFAEAPNVLTCADGAEAWVVLSRGPVE